MYSASEPALFNFGCMIRFSSAICLPLYVGRYSASSFRSASRPSGLGVSMIKRNGLFLMQTTMTAYNMRYAFFPSSSSGEVAQQVWRCSSRHIVSHVSEAQVNSREVRDKLESPLVVIPFLCTTEARRFSPGVEDPEPSWSSFKYECESYHGSASISR